MRHPECESARKNRHGLFVQMHQALELIHYIVTDTSYQLNGHDDMSPMMLNGDSGIALGGPQPRAHKALREFDVSKKSEKFQHPKSKIWHNDKL